MLIRSDTETRCTGLDPELPGALLVANPRSLTLLYEEELDEVREEPKCRWWLGPEGPTVPPL